MSEKQHFESCMKHCGESITNVAHSIWYQRNLIRYLLFPFSLIYLTIISLRRFLYRMHFLKSYRPPVPVIIVGNITVGGTGKTPLVISIVNELKKQGFHPGIITRGYRGKNKVWPQSVTENSDPVLVGDESVLMARATKSPVFAGPKRADDVQLLLKKNPNCNVIVSDDGLQHYALARDIEIVVIDGTRMYGNGLCLPAGPLREPRSRLKKVDFVIFNNNSLQNNVEMSAKDCAVVNNTRCEFQMHFLIDKIVNIKSDAVMSSMEARAKTTTKLNSHSKIFAVAGIGNPERFFYSLSELGVSFTKKIFPDHYCYKKQDFDFVSRDSIIIMTEKDAVKCAAFADERFFVAQGKAVINKKFFGVLTEKLMHK